MMSAKVTANAKTWIRTLAAGAMIWAIWAVCLAPAASAATASAPLAVPAWTVAGGDVLDVKCTSPRPINSCTTDPCTGKVICCDNTSGSLVCTTGQSKK